MRTFRALSVTATLVVLFASWSCTSSTSPTPGSGATITSLAITGATGLSGVGQTVQLTATATFSDGTTQNVTASASWQSSSTGVGSVSSGGLVTAVASGSVTITVTYLGKTATVTIPITLATSTGNTLTATIDGAAFNSIVVTVLKTNNPGVPSGQLLGMAGTSGFSIPYSIVDITIPAAVGTYALGPLAIPNGSVEVLSSATSGQIWSTVSPGASGSVTVNTLTANSASGVFSMTVTATGGTGAAGTKSVTNGVFNVRF